MLMQSFLVDCVLGLEKVEPFTSNFFIKINVKIIRYIGYGRQAAVAVLTDKLKDRVKQRVRSSRGFEVSVTTFTMG